LNLYDEPEPAATPTSEAKPPLWGPVGGWPEGEGEEL
jgi:hypothetical protein